MHLPKTQHLYCTSMKSVIASEVGLCLPGEDSIEWMAASGFDRKRLEEDKALTAMQPRSGVSQTAQPDGCPDAECIMHQSCQRR